MIGLVRVCLPPCHSSHASTLPRRMIVLRHRRESPRDADASCRNSIRNAPSVMAWLTLLATFASSPSWISLSTTLLVMVFDNDVNGHNTTARWPGSPG